jgi:hypothetical protein
MNNFKQNYPAFAALLALFGGACAELAIQGETLVQKFEGEATLLPQALVFLPQASQLGAEAAQLKSSPTDIESGCEVLITDFNFTSAKAQLIISKAFPLAEGIAAQVTNAQALIAAIKS